MKNFAAFSLLVLLVACGTVQAPSSGVTGPGITGTYDLVSYGSRPMPTGDIQRLSIQLTRQGSWQMLEEPGTRFQGTKGMYVAGSTVDGCTQLDLWPEVAPGVTSPMQICEEGTDRIAYLDPSWLPDLNLDGLMVFKKRQ